MPERQFVPCKLPGCPELLKPRRGEPPFCPEHQRPTAPRRGYNAKWRRTRARFLKQHPWCAHCAIEGRQVPAVVLDHVIPREALVDRVPDPDADYRLQALCRLHDNRKKAAEQR